MIEITMRLRFTKPSLGYVERRLPQQHQVLYVMLRDPSGRIMFLPTWWRHGLEYAARVLNRYQDLVGDVAWDQTVDGHPQTYRRKVVRRRQDQTVKSTGYALHEAFRAGDEIGVNAVLPTGLSIEAFTELMNLTGRYRGVSPYQQREEVWGTFEVVSVQPTIRARAEYDTANIDQEVRDGV